ncbi:NAD-dependent succinate-semialdehyde dehydrogenase [Algoriphagus boritolerans]|uniref:Succinate-semialdehyde dehydrogenase / glutarate-semialdehyde dehydrogenase n=1 Tax=Algoriphagus boritolerans DSM 17298 = JCM 18970 TaxID=1120964 RepID=A0A1H5ZP90_9BACT|nr:NAD-dependent succinate-semialdehyde dehydrogenase [Algoriphagus boritolerans]SEG37834.1 succinate-semialdehyde dehydrogenase / glutarate-semialdehyde dehydrogenase [Algoriphagus boritolerans DSM 17298 = JCM 18970]
MSKIQSINPWNGKVIKEFAPLSPGEIETKLELSESTFQSWKRIPVSERASLIKRAGEILRKNKEEYARLITLEMGKIIRESRAEVEKCAWACDYYAEHAEEFLSPERIKLPDGKKAKIIHQPLGAILAVMPWNFPFWQVFRFAAPTLTAGNVGILKHASNVPQCALAIESIFREAGFPEGVFQSFLIDSKATLSLLEDDRVKAVSLTGSEKAGAAVSGSAGKNIKKSLLELGGSDPFIVLADADIPLAAETAVKARMVNFGQSCIAAKRFIIEESVYEEFLKLFTENIIQLKSGDPMEESSDYACMARPDLASELYEQIEKSVELGAKIHLGGQKPIKGSAEFIPTILSDIPEGSPAYSEELFGPVATFFKVKNATEAIRIANATEFGLAASIWTSDLKKGETLAGEIESGAVFLNAMVASQPALPFGGIKKSGFGRELGRQGILEFVNAKTVYLG